MTESNQIIGNPRTFRSFSQQKK